MRAENSPTRPAESILAVMIEVRRMGTVSSVSKVLFCFSMATAEMTICEEYMTIIIRTMGMNIDWEETMPAISEAEASAIRSWTMTKSLLLIGFLRLGGSG